MKAVTNLKRYGYRSVNIFFGEIRPCERTVTCQGDLIQCLTTNVVVVFKSRQGDSLRVKPFNPNG